MDYKFDIIFRKMKEFQVEDNDYMNNSEAFEATKEILSISKIIHEIEQTRDTYTFTRT